MRIQPLLILLLLLANIISTHTSAQVTIGSTVKPNKGSILDLKEIEPLSTGVNANKGLLNARVALEIYNKLAPCIKDGELESGDAEAHIGLMVYNTTDDLSVGLCPGLHVWDGTQWVRIPEPCDLSSVDPELKNTPNCYIVGIGTESVEIPLAKPYLVFAERTDLPDLNLSDKVSVDVLWQDKPSLIDKVELVDGDKSIYSKMKVTTNSGTGGGNAVIAFRVGTNGNTSDPIRWSWHIWVSDYDPNTQVYVNDKAGKTYTFMDRNIGALSTTPTDPNSMGMMYQWGRKDPFPSAVGNYTGETPIIYTHPGNGLLEEKNESAGETSTGILHIIPPVAASGSSNLELSIRNPMEFYYGPYIQGDATRTFDWYSGDNAGTNSDNELWDVSGKKSAYDPCPANWRVPTYENAKSPWYPYAGGQNTSWNDYTDGVKISGNNGFLLSGASDREVLGYYPAGFPRSSRSFNRGGTVGSPGYEYTGGLFLVFEHTYIGSQAMHRGNYWTGTTADNIRGNSMKLYINTVGYQYAAEDAFPKAMGAYVRCVKE